MSFHHVCFRRGLHEQALNRPPTSHICPDFQSSYRLPDSVSGCSTYRPQHLRVLVCLNQHSFARFRVENKTLNLALDYPVGFWYPILTRFALYPSECMAPIPKLHIKYELERCMVCRRDGSCAIEMHLPGPTMLTNESPPPTVTPQTAVQFPTGVHRRKRTKGEGRKKAGKQGRADGQVP